MRTIKRYSNRRLYDTQSSRTITQRELAGLVKKGVEVKVIDTVSDKDITLEVLGRLMMQEAPRWGTPREVRNLFSRVIQAGGNQSMSILKNTILASIGAFHITKAKAEKVIDHLIKEGEVKESQRKQAVLELLDKAEKSTAGWREKVSKEAKRVGTEVNKVAQEIKKYKMAKQSDLKNLEVKVDKLTKSMKALEKKLDSM
jgi:polyhydroxyalkanoate synthesis repressor PhaR